MTSHAVTQLRQLQRSLYEKAFLEAQEVVVAGASSAILAYSATFQQCLPQKFERATLASVIDELRKKQFVLYGDFHTLRQSQRGLLRLLRSYCERLRTNKIVIALEMFKARDQDVLDAFQAGRMSEEDFLETVSYRTEWGFPWPNFRMILDFARTRRLPVIGINTDNGGRDTLAQRDKFAAKMLSNAAERWPQHKIVCMIGEYHLADSHLPAALKREQTKRGAPAAATLRLVNNVDRYYFDMPRENPSNSTEYLQLKRDFFCIMNSPPWMKWQSFSMWEELRNAGVPVLVEGPEDSELDSDLDLHTEDTFDVDYQFFHFVKNLAGFLKLDVEPSDLESFHVYFSQDASFFPDLESEDHLSPREAERLIARASADGVYFLSRSNTVLLTHLSLNNLAEAAGQYLHRLLTGFDDITGDQGQDFLRRIIKWAIGMVASKLLNPRRKCMELHHYKQVARRLKGLRLTGTTAHEKRGTATAVLKFDRWMQTRYKDRKPPPLPKSLVLLDRKLNYDLSREIGQMLGFSLYKKVIAGKVPSTRMNKFFARKLPTEPLLWRELAALYRTMLE